MGASDRDSSGRHRIVETRTLFLLLPSRHGAFVLPKRCFTSAAQIDWLRAIAAGHRYNLQGAGTQAGGFALRIALGVAFLLLAALFAYLTLSGR
ncbi:MAG TPA: YcxB family protein [Thermoanaerobaculia bacterium]